jgi:hypothetical protein
MHADIIALTVSFLLILSSQVTPEKKGKNKKKNID